MKRKAVYLLIGDIIIVAAAFLFYIWLKPASKRVYLPNYYRPFLAFLLVWVVVSLIFNKYNKDNIKEIRKILRSIVISDFVVLSIIMIAIYLFGRFKLSRMIVFGTISTSFLLEMLGAYIINYLSRLKAIYEPGQGEDNEVSMAERVDDISKIEVDSIKDTSSESLDELYTESVRKLIIDESGEKAYEFIARYANLNSIKTLIISTSTRFNIEKQLINQFSGIVNLKRTNDIRYLNKFFETVNTKLSYRGIFIGCVETKNLRKRRILNKSPFIINRIHYTIDFIVKRVFPKLPVVKKMFFFLTQGRNRVITKTEVLGRLYSCGFEIINEEILNGYMYFAFRKVKEPVYDTEPSYGPIFKMKRIGKDGKIIYVYKLRTMHAYSEYLQEYIYERHKLQEGGKFKNDFRISTLGKIFRKFWLDELPMLINFLRSDMKLVGVRPLSSHYLSLYTKELREKRLKHKPGLIPPFYADMPQNIDEIMESEMKYLEAYEKSPFNTDFRYFFKAILNIVLKKARSK